MRPIWLLVLVLLTTAAHAVSHATVDIGEECRCVQPCSRISNRMRPTRVGLVSSLKFQTRTTLVGRIES